MTLVETINSNIQTINECVDFLEKGGDITIDESILISQLLESVQNIVNKEKK